jgi:two-component system, cell cycle response regulator DivK
MTGLVLYIEDHPDNTTLVQRVIQAMGCTFESAMTGKEGIIKMKQLKPDVVLLDMNLPDISGYEIARYMRSSGDPHLLYVPLIAVTANALKGDSEKVLESGCDVYMTKPINIRELMARVAGFMEIIKGPEWSGDVVWAKDENW